MSIFISNLSSHDYAGLSFQSLSYGPITDDSLNMALFNQACYQRDGSKNCSAACQDPEQTFNSIYTLQNCLAYPEISKLLASGNLTSESQELAISLGIQGANITTRINDTINGCLLGYCMKQELCGTLDYTQVSSFEDVQQVEDVGYYRYVIPLLDICYNQTPSPFDPDLGGIGIYISYWMQSGIALLAFILLKSWSSWTYYLSLGIFLWPYGLNGAKQRGQLYQKKWRAHLPALVSALVEFQKAQCFFILALEIAAQIIISRGLFKASSLQQLYNNYALVGSVAISGLLPITFVLLCLHTSKMKSWYIFILSTCAIAVSTVTLYNTSYSNSTPILQPTTTEYAGCSTKDPSVYCLKDLEFDGISAVGLGGGLLPAFALVIWLFLFFDQYDLSHRPWFRRLLDWSLSMLHSIWRYALRSMLRLQRTLKSRWKWIATFDTYRFFLQLWLHRCFRNLGNSKTWLKIKDTATRFTGIVTRKVASFLNLAGLKTSRDWLDLFVNLVFGVVWIVYLNYFYYYFKLLQFFTTFGALQTSSWGIGQIVGLTVWIPAIIEFANLEFRGMQKGSRYRIAFPYKVTTDMAKDPDAKGPSLFVDVTTFQSPSTDPSRESLLSHNTST